MYRAILCTIQLFILFSCLSAPALALPTPICAPDEVCLENPLSTDSPEILIGRIIRAILGITGSLALVTFTYGGFVWMASAGNEKQVRKGKNILVWATLGLAVIFSSYALVRFILGDVLGLA